MLFVASLVVSASLSLSKMKYFGVGWSWQLAGADTIAVVALPTRTMNLLPLSVLRTCCDESFSLKDVNLRPRSHR